MHGAQRIEQAVPDLWRSILAASAGNVLEWYDFSVYAYMAPFIAEKFFPGGDPLAGLLSVFATFGLGFVVRPLGGILIGRMGDLAGPKGGAASHHSFDGGGHGRHRPGSRPRDDRCRRALAAGFVPSVAGLFGGRWMGQFHRLYL